MLIRSNGTSLRRSGVALTFLMGLSCSNENFRGGGNKVEPTPIPATVAATPTPTPPTPGVQSLKLTCDGNNSSTNSFTSLQGKSTDSIKIEGEFCPSVFAEMTILFVVDFSGSMATNDPIVSGSCGRLSSAQSILARIKEKVRAQDKVNVGVVSFSTSASLIVSLTAIDKIDASVTSTNFCGQSGSTNYAEAFKQAKTALLNATGSKTVYFISDGEPDVSGMTSAQAQQAGLTEAQNLKTAIPTLAINAIYLQSGSSSGSFNPQSYLEQITGSADRVKVASAASTLADEILKFGFPTLEVDEKTAKGFLKVGASSTTGPVEIESFARNTAKTGVWSYVTKPFKLQGTKDTAVLNQVTITAQDKAGKEQTANVVISYKQLD